ncbi:MAG TPA: phage/plasmid replication protein [Pyrinomonadaceae bacterium]|jgi:hypothetical protein|nr:phage/plasmid replication protein [Pyrinomonadaceae bacterium]
MFDTVAIKHALTWIPTEEYLLSLGWRPRYSMFDGTIYAFTLNQQKSSVEPHLTIALTPQKQWHLKAEASLPKLLHGVNVPLLDESEIASSIRLMCASVEKCIGRPFDPATALVCRMDCAQDIHIEGGSVLPVIAKFQKVQIPRYDRTPHNDTSVVFTPKGENKSKRISIYDKYAEVIQRNGTDTEKHNARGIARLEVGLRTKAITYLTEKLELPNREAQHILTREVADFVLRDALQKFQFDSIGQSTNENIERLINHFGTSRAKSLLGFLEIKSQFGEDLYKYEELKYPRRTYFRDLADCRRAGVLP